MLTTQVVASRRVREEGMVGLRLRFWRREEDRIGLEESSFLFMPRPMTSKLSVAFWVCCAYVVLVLDLLSRGTRKDTYCVAEQFAGDMPQNPFRCNTRAAGGNL